MKTLLISLAALTLLSCDVKKRHQRLVRKHPHLLELIVTPAKDTIRIDNTKQVECPDGTVITVDCDTLIIYETNTITLPPTNAQIRAQERSRRIFEDNVRKMYQDSLKHIETMFRLENRRLKRENRELSRVNSQNQKTERTELRQDGKNNRTESRSKWWQYVVIGFWIFILLILAAIVWRIARK